MIPEERRLLVELQTQVRELLGEDLASRLKAAVLALAEADGYGFSPHDAPAGRALAAKIRAGDPLSDADKRLALRFVRKSRRQLTEAGIDAARILEHAEAEKEKEPSQATRLVSIGREVEVWHAPDGEAFATVVVGGHHQHWPLRSKFFRQWLARRFYESEGKAPGGQALQDALNVLEG